ncbi:MAG: DUF1501 domain-containing protein [Planctomycetaceae bacterium]|nr:DUF1501 domain-containing protein [Planctomycetaceae bacterium]
MPRINNAGGQDHRPNVNTCLMAGDGTRSGQVDWSDKSCCCRSSRWSIDRSTTAKYSPRSITTQKLMERKSRCRILLAGRSSSSMTLSGCQN